jgi:tetraacyldisaccharide 4'-kinase
MGSTGLERQWRVKGKFVDLPSPLLTSIGFFYAIGMKFRLWAYKVGLLKTRYLPGFVVSIGNITVGGTGKTPAAVMLSKWALKQGCKVAILSRGYKGRYKKRVLVVSDEHGIRVEPEESGDEAFLMAKKLPGVPVVLSKKRFLAGKTAYEQFGTDFFILDDGFQHLALGRDLNVVLVDGNDPFGNGHLLPGGPLREPLYQLIRADIFILTRLKKELYEKRNIYWLKKAYPRTPVFFAEHKPEKVVFPFRGKEFQPAFLNKKRIIAFAGIAKPETFKETLIELGAEILYFKRFRDHYQFKKKDLEAIIKMGESKKARFIVTTEKDWVRIASFAFRNPKVCYMSIKFDLLSKQNRFREIIKDGFNKKRIQ